MATQTTNLNLTKQAENEYYDINIINENLDKIDQADGENVKKVAGKGLSTEDYTTEEKTKLAGVEDGANNYIHPASHNASIINQDSTRRFVSDTEKATWNAAEQTANQNVVKIGNLTTLTTTEKTSTVNAINEIHTKINTPQTTTVTNTTSIFSIGNTLSDSVYYGILDMLIGGQTLVNSIKNGNFSNGTTGWSAVSATINVADNILSCTANGTNVRGDLIHYTKLRPKIGDKIFAYIRIRATNPDATGIFPFLYDNGSYNYLIGGVPIYYPTQNQWYEQYGIINSLVDASQAVQFRAYHQYPDATTANGKVMEVDGNAGVFAINMTALGIADYTEEQMLDYCRNGYIDGMASTSPCRITSVGKNLFDGKLLNGYYDGSGIFIPSTAYKASKKIKINPNKTNVISGLNQNVILSKWDSSNNYIGLDSSFANGDTINNVGYIAFRGNTFLNPDTIQIEEGTTPTTYEPHKSSILYTREPLRYVPTARDTTDSNSNKIKKVGRYVLQSGDIASMFTSLTNVDMAITTVPFIADAKAFISEAKGQVLSSWGTEVLASERDSINSIGKFATLTVTGGNRIDFIFAKGTSLAEARTELAGKEILYELAEPIHSTVFTAPLESYTNGTVYIENIKADVSFYNNGITVTDSNYPIKSIDYINKVNKETGEKIALDVSNATIAGDGLSFTHTDLTDGDLVDFDYFYTNSSITPYTEHSAPLNVAGGVESNSKAIVRVSESSISKAEKGVNNGVASLDDEGRLLLTQLPKIIDRTDGFNSMSAKSVTDLNYTLQQILSVNDNLDTTKRIIQIDNIEVSAKATDTTTLSFYISYEMNQSGNEVNLQEYVVDTLETQIINVPINITLGKDEVIAFRVYAKSSSTSTAEKLNYAVVHGYTYFYAIITE